MLLITLRIAIVPVGSFSRRRRRDAVDDIVIEMRMPPRGDTSSSVRSVGRPCVEAVE